MKEYTVIYESGKRNWSAYVPDLPGCIATGKTRKLVEKQIREHGDRVKTYLHYRDAIDLDKCTGIRFIRISPSLRRTV